MDAPVIPEPFAINPGWHKRDNDFACNLAWLAKGQYIDISDDEYEVLCPPLQRLVVKERRTGDAFTIRNLSVYVYRKA